jgi:hypothetical protein
MTVLELKYWKTSNNASRSSVIFSSILTLAPSFLDQNKKKFYQNDQHKKLYRIGFDNKFLKTFLFSVVDYW